ncbi:MAG: flagellar hook-associated protein FlgK [Chromatium okenii]|nr:flagellar hook-associated protein FlgK [Chromatium okenii]MBV5308599.1 flagellar hook-associated protein FlgK [Chromatium okenii]
MSILSTGVSGVMAFRSALATTGHNISNSATEGYSRQRVEIVPQNAESSGSNYYIGQGSRLISVQRIKDDLVNAQVRNALTVNSNTEIRMAYVENFDRVLADETTGLTPVLDEFSAAVQDVANDPTSIPNRITFLNSAQTLTGRLSAVNGQLQEQRTMINGQLSVAVDELNQFAQAVAKLNSDITAGSTAQSPSNDLLDQRDLLLNKMAQKVDISLTTQDDGAINVFVGNGQALVMGANAKQLLTGHFSGDPQNLDIGAHTSSEDVSITRVITGGKIGGLLETRSILDTVQNTLGLIGLTLATKFNEQNGLGLDLNGDIGGDLFQLPEISVYPKPSNTQMAVQGVSIGSANYIDHLDVTMAVPGVTIGDVTALSASDYRLRYENDTFQLTRQPNNTAVTLTVDPVDSNVLIGDGLRIDTSAISGANQGDTWLIQPTRLAASNLPVIMTDPAKVAAASSALEGELNTGNANLVDLRITAATPATYRPAAIVVNETADKFNLISVSDGDQVGGASVDSFRILDPKQVNGGATVTYDATQKQFSVNGEHFSLDPSGLTTITTSGWELRIRGTPETGTVFNVNIAETSIATEEPVLTKIVGKGWELDVEGTPKQYDTFSVDLSKGRNGDNRNLLAMTELQTSFLVQGQETFTGSYNSLLTEVGSKTRHAQIEHSASTTLLEDAQASRESVSGVNLDEEAANMLKFQQAYQAAAQVIAVTGVLFDTLLNAVQ